MGSAGQTAGVSAVSVETPPATGGREGGSLLRQRGRESGQDDETAAMVCVCVCVTTVFCMQLQCMGMMCLCNVWV